MNNPEFSLDDTDFQLPYVNCINMNPNTNNDFLNDFQSDSFSLLSFNIRSCRKNFASLCSLISEGLLMFRFSIITLCETWLDEKIDHGFDLPGYGQLNLYRHGHGGGLKVYYDKCFNVEGVDRFTIINEFIEILTFYLIGTNFRYLICSVYRPPSSCPFSFCRILFEQILNNLPPHCNVIITGDNGPYS